MWDPMGGLSIFTGWFESPFAENIECSYCGWSSLLGNGLLIHLFLNYPSIMPCDLKCTAQAVEHMRGVQNLGLYFDRDSCALMVIYWSSSGYHAHGGRRRLCQKYWIWVCSVYEHTFEFIDLRSLYSFRICRQMSLLHFRRTPTVENWIHRTPYWRRCIDASYQYALSGGPGTFSVIKGLASIRVGYIEKMLLLDLRDARQVATHCRLLLDDLLRDCIHLMHRSRKPHSSRYIWLCRYDESQ